MIIAYSIVFDIAVLDRQRRALGKQLVCFDELLNEITEANGMTALMSLVWEDLDEKRIIPGHGEWYDPFVGSVYFMSLAEHVRHLESSPEHAVLIESLDEFASALKGAHVTGAKWRLSINRRPHA